MAFLAIAAARFPYGVSSGGDSGVFLSVRGQAASGRDG